MFTCARIDRRRRIRVFIYKSFATNISNIYFVCIILANIFIVTFTLRVLKWYMIVLEKRQLFDMQYMTGLEHEQQLLYV